MGNTASCNSDSSGGTSYVKQNQSSTASFFSGMATGMAGMMGVSGFWDPYGSQGFDKLTADYNTMKEQLIVNDGSIQSIEAIPDYIKNIFKTAWELKQKHIIDMAADRGKFICQSQSLNLFMEAPNFSKLSSMHFYAWKKGLKTGMYYLRSRPSSKAIQFTVSPEVCETCSA